MELMKHIERLETQIKSLNNEILTSKTDLNEANSKRIELNNQLQQLRNEAITKESMVLNASLLESQSNELIKKFFLLLFIK
jgi:septal ring factor EnvC (AmiA/AmiB activator)